MPRADLEIAPMVLPFLLPSFFNFFQQSKSIVQTHYKPTHALLNFEKKAVKRPTTHR